jgi:uncharacterized protein (DUF2336 family)
MGAKASRLAQLCTVRRLPEAVLCEVDAALVHLLGAAIAAVRADVALRLSTCDWAPLEAVRMLAFDEIDIARPLLERSRRLSDADLETLAGLDTERRYALAGRPHVGEHLSILIAARREHACLLRLAGNHAAALSDASAADFAGVARGAPDLQRSLAARADLRPGLARVLMVVAEDAVRADLAVRWPELDLERLPGRGEDDRDQPADPTQDSQAEALVNRLARQGDLGAADLVRAAAGGRDAFTDHIAARLTGLETADWRRALTRSPLRACLLCARATALPGAEAAAFHQALAEYGRVHALTPDQLATACEEIYTAYARDEARRALHRLGAGASIH